MPEEERPLESRGRSRKWWLTSALGVALLLTITVHLARSDEDFSSLRKLSFEVLLLTCLLQFLSQLCLNASLLLPLQSCVKSLGFWELYLVRTGGSVVGSVVPVVGGVGVRLAYLRSRGVTYLEFTWATLLSNVLALGAAAVLAALATGALWITVGRPSATVLVIAAAVLAGSVAAVAAFELLPVLTRHRRFERWRWLAPMSRLTTTSRRLAASVFVIALARHGFNFVTFGLLSQSVSGVPGDFLVGGVVYVLTSPIRTVNITPANLGVIEWIVALVGKALAFDLATGLVVALAFRGVGLVAQGLGAVFGSAWLALWGRP